VLSFLSERKAEVSVDREFHHFLTTDLHLDVRADHVFDDDAFDVDFVISMGGDGTFLKAASRVGEKCFPIMGVNMGRLGFLADVGADEIDQAIELIFEGSCRIEERSVLKVESTDELHIFPYALNEVAVLKRDNSSMISIRVDINGEYLTTYQADGLIINTPTGSTGYALSVGGPIMSPESQSIGITPVAPHSLNMRPITLPDQAQVTLSVESRNHNFLVAIDGRSDACTEDVRLTVCRAPYNIKVVKRPESSFFRTLRTKLMWGNDVRIEN
jgi:NAD+ kinase